MRSIRPPVIGGTARQSMENQTVVKEKVRHQHDKCLAWPLSKCSDDYDVYHSKGRLHYGNAVTGSSHMVGWGGGKIVSIDMSLFPVDVFTPDLAQPTGSGTHWQRRSIQRGGMWSVSDGKEKEEGWEGRGYSLLLR